MRDDIGEVGRNLRRAGDDRFCRENHPVDCCIETPAGRTGWLLLAVGTELLGSYVVTLCQWMKYIQDKSFV